MEAVLKVFKFRKLARAHPDLFGRGRCPPPAGSAGAGSAEPMASSARCRPNMAAISQLDQRA